MELYFNAKSRAGRVFLLVEELGLDCTIIDVDFEKKEQKGEAVRAISPLGQLPAFVDGDTAMFESVAICIYLADKYGDHELAPAHDSVERGAYLQWCVYTVATLEMAIYAQMMRDKGNDLPGVPQLDETLEAIQNALGDRDTLLASGFSAADILIASTLGWLGTIGTSIPERLQRYIASCSERASFKKLAELHR